MNDDELPSPKSFMATITALHQRSAGKSPTGKLGLPIDIKFPHLTMPNCWDASCKSWCARHIYIVFEREIQGPIPLRIRPLERVGRSTQATLLQADLWLGNVKFKRDSEKLRIFDANAVWGHNKSNCETLVLDFVANPRYLIGEACIQEYWKHIPAPKEDADSRIIIYMIRCQACLASVYTNELDLRDM
ncbi:hypothetical protein HD806DRAFT_525687 [Xylariaceae sp. AK1471]|nr:hypothetical protein HD806DRAFT_525687 [Xylariaceae sp. AK1471]